MDGEQTKQPNDRWGNDIGDERKARLEQQLQAWEKEADHGERKGPFAGVRLTGADIYWLASRTPPPKPPQGVVLGGTVPDLSELHLEGANLIRTHLEGASLYGVHLEGAALGFAHLEGANLACAHLEGVNCWMAHLERAVLNQAHLEKAILWWARLEGASLQGAHLEGAYCVGASLDRNTRLNGAHFNYASLDQVDFGGTSLTVLDWAEVRRLGDETLAHWPKDAESKPKDRQAQATDHQAAIRANRQLATALRDQGVNEHADRFAYRAQVLQRQLLWLEAGLPHWGAWPLILDATLQRLVRRLVFLSPVQKLGKWLFSWVLAVLAGYGYKPGRTLAWYFLFVMGFALAYTQLGHVSGHPFTLSEALVFSVTSFHGRGFFPGSLGLKDAVTRLAAAEAVCGLVIEASFIATFTQRFFTR